MAIVTLHLPDVKASIESRPSRCPNCGSPILQRWGGALRSVKDTHVQQVLVYRYRCMGCRRTFRHYPEGITSAHQSQRLVYYAGLCWVLGLSLRATSAILSAYPVALSHTSIWRDVQALSASLKRKLSHHVRVLGLDGFYPRVRGQEQATLVAVDLGRGTPIALAAISEKDWRGVVKWLEPMVIQLGIEVIVTDDLKEYGVVAHQLKLSHQVCHFHWLRWLWLALEKLRQQLDSVHHSLLDEVWQIAKDRPNGGRVRLFELWKGISVRRERDAKTSALYRLRLLILRLQENWEKYSLDQRQRDVPATNNGTEQAIGKWRIRSRSTRGFKSWIGLEAAFLLCGSDIN